MKTIFLTIVMLASINAKSSEIFDGGSKLMEYVCWCDSVEESPNNKYFVLRRSRWLSSRMINGFGWIGPHKISGQVLTEENKKYYFTSDIDYEGPVVIALSNKVCKSTFKSFPKKMCDVIKDDDHLPGAPPIVN